VRWPVFGRDQGKCLTRTHAEGQARCGCVC
jgi:hypothetical protein